MVGRVPKNLTRTEIKAFRGILIPEDYPYQDENIEFDENGIEIEVKTDVKLVVEDRIVNIDNPSEKLLTAVKDELAK